MHVLTVVDHPNPASFSHAVAAEFMRGASEAGHSTELADLNAEGFSPLWSMTDIKASDTPPEDVKREQARIERCDAICLVFPLFWWGMPAMMKGWMDRVFSWGWAYDQLDDLEGSLLKNRTGVLLIPAGARSDEMEDEGYTAALETLWTKGTFGFFGFSPRKLELLNGATGSARRRAALLERSYRTGLTLERPNPD